MLSTMAVLDEPQFVAMDAISQVCTDFHFVG